MRRVSRAPFRPPRSLVLTLSVALLALAIWRGPALYRWIAPGSDGSIERLPSGEVPAPTLGPVSSDGRATTSPELEALCQDVYRAVCKKRGETRDPTGMVRPDIEGEKLARQAYREIIERHPDWPPEQVDEELVKNVYSSKRRGRMESAYHWVERAEEAFFEQQPPWIFNAREKRIIVKRLRETELQLPPPASVYADEPDLFTKNDVYYERTLDGKMRMRVGGAYLFTAKSWFNMAFTVAHELGHAIDPCEIRSAGLSFPAYDRLSACFLRDGLIAARKTRSECGHGDQLSETFADWVAVNVTAEALKALSVEYHGAALAGAAINSVRDLCEQDDDDFEVDNEYHPSPKTRIDRIFGQNPSVREVLGCSPPAAPGPEYCGFQTILSVPRPPIANRVTAGASPSPSSGDKRDPHPSASPQTR